MSEILLNVQTRDGVGTQVAKKLRKENKVPGIYYHHGAKNIPFYVDRKDLHAIWGHESALLDVVFDNNETKKCVVRDIQFDPIKGRPIHIDLMGIKMTEKIKVNIHIHLVGIPEGVKNSGGVLQHIMRDLEVECLPSDIPEKIEVDVSHLDIGDSLPLSVVNLENVTIHGDPEAIVATVSAPRVVAVEEPVEGEEGAEPEVIAQKAEESE